MNAAQLHLAFNHLPIVGVPIGAIFLAAYLLGKNDSFKVGGLWILALTAIAALPVYLGGGFAEDVVEKMPGITESLIEAHEDAGLIAMIFSLFASIMALLCLYHKILPEKLGKILSGVSAIKLLFCLALIATGTLVWTAKLGGEIHHPEARPDFVLDAREE